MSDIFISYSSKDREQAELLTELLASAGLSVWIDRSGIGAATSWSKEIVQAIDQCKAFVLLISPSSNESTNVHKELSLAAEKKKKILPLDLEPIALSEDLQYHLAGLQRTSMTNIDAIIRALGKLGLEATGAPQAPKIVKEQTDKKSLMVLPFEDLSPTGDNGWFADGIASELISALSNVKALRVADPQATKEFKAYKGRLAMYAKEMSIRYFVQGDVRKFSDNIKITCRLLDIESGDFLWQDSMKGTMSDVFEIQEEVAKKVTDGLNIILSSDEMKKLAERGTANAEAFELNLKAHEYFLRQTKDGIQLAIQLLSEALNLDPSFAQAYSNKANALAELYRLYDRDPHLLDEALSILEQAKRLKPDLQVNAPLSVILLLQGKVEEAERAAHDYVQSAPLDNVRQCALGFVYGNSGQYAKAIAAFEEAVTLKPDDLGALFNLTLACNLAKEDAKLKQWAQVAIPKYEKHLRLFPDDEHNRVGHALLLHYAGRDEDARAAATTFDDLLDANSLNNAACLYCLLKDYESGLRAFRKAIEAGYRSLRDLQLFLDEEDAGLAALKGTTEYQEVKQMIEKIVAEHESGHTLTNPVNHGA